MINIPRMEYGVKYNPSGEHLATYSDRSEAIEFITLETETIIVSSL